MLKGISPLISPQLLKVLCEMGHGDTVVLADGNFPSESVGKDAIVIRADGHGVPELLDGILQIFPLDDFVDISVQLMKVPDGETVATPIWDTYKEIVAKYDKRGNATVQNIPKMQFMEETRKSYCIIATGEKALYANIMLRKGCV